jgi:hypothetical protein
MLWGLLRVQLEIRVLWRGAVGPPLFGKAGNYTKHKFRQYRREAPHPPYSEPPCSTRCFSKRKLSSWQEGFKGTHWVSCFFLNAKCFEKWNAFVCVCVCVCGRACISFSKMCCGFFHFPSFSQFLKWFFPFKT